MSAMWCQCCGRVLVNGDKAIISYTMRKPFCNIDCLNKYYLKGVVAHGPKVEQAKQGDTEGDIT